MPEEKAKRVLLAYRRGIPLVEEPEVLSALHLVENDPEMREWLARQGDWQERTVRELRNIASPPGLRARILNGRKARPPLWRRMETLAAAAAMVLLLVFVPKLATAPGDKESFDGFRSRMVKFAEREYRMDLVTNNLAAIRGFLTAQKAPADFALTPVLQKTTPLGCGRLAWQGHAVAMVCFELKKSGALYLFVMNRADIPDGQALPTQPQIEQGRRFAAASWNQGEKIYLLTAPIAADQLATYVK